MVLKECLSGKKPYLVYMTPIVLPNYLALLYETQEEFDITSIVIERALFCAPIIFHTILLMAAWIPKIPSAKVIQRKDLFQSGPQPCTLWLV